MQKTIEITNSEITARLFGSYDKNAARVEEAFRRLDKYVFNAE